MRFVCSYGRGKDEILPEKCKVDFVYVMLARRLKKKKADVRAQNPKKNVAETEGTEAQLFMV